MSGQFGILGAGGQADEAESYTDDEVLFKAIDERYINRQDSHQIVITSPSDQQKEAPIVAAVGAPKLRKLMIETWPGNIYTTILSKTAYIDQTARIGMGCIVAPGAVITTNVFIGVHSIINVSASVSHNTKLGDYVTISPGARVAGNVELGDGVFVGIGATISNGVKIAAGCVVGAGAVVINDVIDENSVVVGVPGRVIKQNDGWLNAI